MVAIALDIVYFNKGNSTNYFHNFLSSGNISEKFNSIGDNKLNDQNINSKSNEKNILIVFNLFSNKIKKIFISNCSIVDCLTIGKNENFIFACREDGVFDIYDIKKVDEVYYNYKVSELNITREIENVNKNLVFNSHNPDLQNNIFEYNLSLPILSSISSFDSNHSIKMDNKIIKILRKGNYESNKIYTLDKRGNLFFMVATLNYSKLSNDKFKKINNNQNDNNFLKKLYEVNIEEKLKSILKGNELKCYDIKIYKKDRNINNEKLDSNNVNFYQDIFLINSNLGMIKLTLIGKNDFNIRIIYNNYVEKNILTSFDLSDTGLILASFSDMTIKVLDINDFTCIFYVNIAMDNLDTTINKVYWASVICKNIDKKLIRKSLTANFFAITSKNEFIIYDLNQKNKNDIKKIKKKIELGTKKGLNRKNSIIDFS